jgi:tetratricopeptide (TPR) repeat protein
VRGARGILAAVLAAGLHLGCEPPPAVPEAGPPAVRVQAPVDRQEIVRRHGLADPEHPLVRRAHLVFARVREAAQPRVAVPATLVVLAGPERPEALALGDRSVAVNLAALELCYWTPADREGRIGRQGDARLAFVLGHELAHLEADDFWHLAAFAALARHEPLAELASDTLAERRRREVAADLRGLLFTLIAGFPATELVAVADGFFERWDARLRELERVPGGPHAPSDLRSRAVLGQLLELERAFDAFRLGTVLYALGRYDDAIRLLQRFEHQFPGTEVRTNLGLAHFQAAAGVLDRCAGAEVHRLRYPTRLAAREWTRLRGPAADGCRSSGPFLAHVSAGRAALEAAAEQDPRDVASRLGLVSLELLAGRSAAAFAPATLLVEEREAPALAPGDPDALVAAALAFLAVSEDNGLPTRERALEYLDRALAIAPRHPVALFDRGVILLEQDPRDQSGRAALEAFLEIEPSGEWAERARRLLGAPPGELELEPVDPFPSPGSPFPLGAAGAARLPSPAEIQRVDDLRFLVKDGSVLLVLEPAPELAEPRSAADLDRLRGASTDRLVTTLGEIRVYRGFGHELVAGKVVSTFFFEPE